MNTPPLVTMGVPVRNGEAMIRNALDSIIAQDYPNIEVVVSDNASNDGTPDILRDYAARFPNIRVIRQEHPLTAIDNFMFVLKQARGEYFVWCAHDDTRSPDYISGLLPAFDDLNVVLAFGELFRWDGVGPPVCVTGYDFENGGLTKWQRLRKAAHMQCYHIYGLWRTRTLHAIRYRYTHWWSDMPIVLAAAAMGTFRYVPGPQFVYYEVVKSMEERAKYQDNRATTSRLKNFAGLFRSTILTVGRTVGVAAAAASVGFLVEKYAREAIRRVQAGNLSAAP